MRRLPVAGTSGYTVILRPDGFSELEAPDGTRTLLTEASHSTATDSIDLARITARLNRKVPRRAEDGQLIVLEKGVVDVPKEAMIVYIGPDYLVTRDEAGDSIAYHVDGRVERRARPGGTAP